MEARNEIGKMLQIDISKVKLSKHKNSIQKQSNAKVYACIEGHDKSGKTISKSKTFLLTSHSRSSLLWEESISSLAIVVTLINQSQSTSVKIGEAIYNLPPVNKSSFNNENGENLNPILDLKNSSDIAVERVGKIYCSYQRITTSTLQTTDGENKCYKTSVVDDLKVHQPPEDFHFQTLARRINWDRIRSLNLDK